MRKIKLFFLLLTCAVGLNAQDIPSSEDAAKKKEINQIKLSEEAVYADVMQAAATPEEAIELSKTRTFTMLQTHVVETVVKDMNMSREDAKKLWAELEGKCHHIVVSQMDMFRVFTYIMRADLMPGAAQTEQPVQAVADATPVQAVVPVAQPVQPVQAGVAAQPADSTSVAQAQPQPVQPVTPVAQPVDSAAVAVAQPVQPVQTVAAQPVDSALVAQAQPVQPVTPVAQPVDSAAVAVAQPVQAVQPVQAAPVQAVPVVAAQPVQAVQPVAEPEPEPEPEPEVEIEIPALCQTMIDKGNMSDLMRFLNTEKNYQRLMYGNSSTMQYPEKCYIVIIDKETREIVSVLDKGQRERMNFITKEIDRYSNYRRGNYAAVFVQEY